MVACMYCNVAPTICVGVLFPRYSNLRLNGGLDLSRVCGLKSRKAAKSRCTCSLGSRKQTPWYILDTSEKHIAAAATKVLQTCVTRFVRRQSHRFRPRQTRTLKPACDK
ncbi:unnamed protein product [Laminaria digitata]